MKQLKVLALAALAMLIAAPAFAAVEFSGQAAGKFGFTSSQSSEKNADAESAMGIGQDTGAELAAAFTSGKVTAGVAFRANADGIAQEAGWAQYNFGVAQLKYNAIGSDSRWNGDIGYFGDAANQAFTVTAMDMIFVTLMDTYEVGYQAGSVFDTGKVDEDGDPIMDQQTSIPAISLGLDSTFGPAAVKAGTAIMMYGDKDAAGEDTKFDSYTAMLFFLDTSISLGNIGINAAFNYQMGSSEVTGGQKGGADEGSAMGIRLGGTFTTGAIELGYHGGWATANDGKEDFAKMDLVDFYLKYSLDNNFYIKPLFTYSMETSDSFAQDATDMEFAIVMGYSF